MYNSDMGDMFDISEARVALQAKRLELLAECDANAKLQRRYVQYVHSFIHCYVVTVIVHHCMMLFTVLLRFILILSHNFDQNNHISYPILFFILLLSFDQINAQIRGGGGSSGSQVTK